MLGMSSLLVVVGLSYQKMKNGKLVVDLPMLLANELPELHY